MRMFCLWRLSTVPAFCLIVLMSVSPISAFAKSSEKKTGHYLHLPRAITQSTVIPECSPARKGYARCLALREMGIPATLPNLNLQPSGYHPADLQSAYKLLSVSKNKGKGQLVAIIDAFDNPNAEKDLAVYRARFGLPPCTTANGCFRKVDQRGGTHYPHPDAGWAAEISLDLDMVSAICPNCRILLVEADTNYLKDLGTAVNKAVALGAKVISNSYGAAEFASEQEACKTYYRHPGTVITASTGDDGYGTQFPAACNTVTAAGGTKLLRVANKWNETVWNGTGSGCSVYIAKPAWQRDAGCSKRTIGDVSAVADPATGVSVYNTYNAPGWIVLGGTSVSAPIIASVYALAGNASKVVYGSYPYNHSNRLRDVTVGSNGTCTPAYLCTGKKGYDGPTGLGTPQGTGAF